ncbi:universal stress protein [Thermodesulfobacteriota bacterium]
MTDINKILVAIGFSKYTQINLDYAAKLASDLSAHLVIANVINIRDIQAVSSIESMGYKVDSDDYIKGIKNERKILLDGMLKTTGLPDDKITIIFKVGNPFKKLMEIVSIEDIDLVVMGAKGRTDLEHVLLGSIAEKMMRHSPVPILSYRDKLNLRS